MNSSYVRRLRLARELLELRKESGLTHAELAAKIGQSRAQISRLENGLAPGLTLIRLAGILLVLDWPPREPARSSWFEMVAYADDDAPPGIAPAARNG